MVVKIGTSILMRNGTIRSEVFGDLARQAHYLTRAPQTDFVVLVSSGAIRMGWEMMRSNIFPETTKLSQNSLEECGIEEKKLLAATGQHHLMRLWAGAFARYGREVAQVLVTHANWENESERESVRNTLWMCMERRVVPIVNENDVVSAIEIRFMERGLGENDILAAYVARLMNANGILFLTESGGVRSTDPKEVPNAPVISVLALDDLNTIDTAESGSGNGRGGMGKKLDAVRVCAEHNPGMSIMIAGREEDVIVRFKKGDPIGTRITIGAERP